MSRQPQPGRSPARVAIDLGAESCRVSLLRWVSGSPQITLVHRTPNGPDFDPAAGPNGELRWPLARILLGIRHGLVLAANLAPEGIASIAVDGWAVDYLRLTPADAPESEPYCYRDIRTEAAKATADAILPPEEIFALTGAQPLRINTVYQLLADREAGRDPDTPWVQFPEYVLFWLGARRIAEYTNASHTGMVEGPTRQWSPEIFSRLGLSLAAAPPIVQPGTVVGRISGPLANLPAYRNTALIAPACHDTASAIAAIPFPMESSAYLVAGTWSLVGTLVPTPISTPAALAAGFTNQGAAVGGSLFHTNVNGMWLLKQCLDHWNGEDRNLDLIDLITQAAQLPTPDLRFQVDAPHLLLAGKMPKRINTQLTAEGSQPIPDTPGNEPLFFRVILESLALRYAQVIAQVQQLTGRQFTQIVMVGGANRNQLLVRLTEAVTGLPILIGPSEGSTLGNLAIQLAASESQPMDPSRVLHWASILGQADFQG